MRELERIPLYARFPPRIPAPHAFTGRGFVERSSALYLGASHGPQAWAHSWLLVCSCPCFLSKTRDERTSTQSLRLSFFMLQWLAMSFLTSVVCGLSWLDGGSFGVRECTWTDLSVLLPSGRRHRSVVSWKFDWLIFSSCKDKYLFTQFTFFQAIGNTYLLTGRFVILPLHFLTREESLWLHLTSLFCIFVYWVCFSCLLGLHSIVENSDLGPLWLYEHQNSIQGPPQVSNKYELIEAPVHNSFLTVLLHGQASQVFRPSC